MQATATDLLAEAAAIGPGFKGKKSALSPEARTARAKEILNQWGEDAPPTYLAEIADGKNPTWIDRKAKLFEVGEYNDRDLNVRPSDLQRLAASFSAPAPIWVEHTKSPLEMGYLTDVQAIGQELFGILSLTPEADKLLENSGAKSLSISVSKNLDRIFEVSIVGKPRVESARLFCEDFTETSAGRWKQEALQLRQQALAQRHHNFVDSLLKAGKLLPAQREATLNMLEQAAEKGIEQQFADYLAAGPTQIHFGEIAAATMKSVDLPQEEREFYSRHFPNIELAEIAKRRNP